MHNHDKCKHELKYCDKCDVVYCEKCKKEWGRDNGINIPYTPTVPIYPYVPNVPNYPVWTWTDGTVGHCFS